jgi:hypothetical protein
MKIKHPSAKLNLFKLAGTFEADLALSRELNFPIRFEVFQDTEKSGWFRVRVWEQESFRIEPTFPIKRRGKITRYRCDEILSLERTVTCQAITAGLRPRIYQWLSIKLSKT